MNPVMRFDFKNESGVIFDFTERNPELTGLDLNHEATFTNYIFDHIRKANVSYGIGCYNENRVLYERSTVFNGTRSIHLGIDIWASAGEEVYAPCDGTIHSFRNNSSHGDYGPTIILKHTLENTTFYSLYGHLSRASLNNISVDQPIRKGDKIGTLGEYEENVHWPPHLHFQLMTDMMGYEGDFPGVAAPDRHAEFLRICPDPNLILGITCLQL